MQYQDSGGQWVLLAITVMRLINTFTLALDDVGAPPL